MSQSDKPSNPAKGPAVQDDPRAAALRANLARRKQQAGARRSGKAVAKTEASVFDTLNDHKPNQNKSRDKSED